MLSPAPARSSKKLQTTSPTVCPSLVSSTDNTINYNSSHPELYKGSLAVQPCLFDLDGVQDPSAASDAPLNSDWPPQSPPPRETSMAGKIVEDDSIFLQFICSPSPSYLPSVSANHGDRLTGPTAQKSTNPDPSSPDATPSIQNEVPHHQAGPRLHLRVGPPRLKITLQVIKPSTKNRGRRRRSQAAK